MHNENGTHGFGTIGCYRDFQNRGVHAGHCTSTTITTITTTTTTKHMQ